MKIPSSLPQSTVARLLATEGYTSLASLREGCYLSEYSTLDFWALCELVKAAPTTMAGFLVVYFAASGKYEGQDHLLTIAQWRRRLRRDGWMGQVYV